MNIEYINPFIEASQTVLKQVTNIDAKLGKVYLRSSPYKGESILIIVGITGKMRGQAIFTMTKTSALKIASAMMYGMHVDELNEISKSALSELTNMILGNTATLLYNKGIGIEITPPSLLLGENLQISPSKMKTICVPLYLTEEQTEALEIDISVED
jgi:chemotaxis protein CheX